MLAFGAQPGDSTRERRRRASLGRGPAPGINRAAAQPGLGALDGAGDSVFRLAPTRAAGDDDLVAFARAHPGQLLGLAIEEVDKFLAAREGATAQGGTSEASRFVAYLTCIFHAAHPPDKVGSHLSAELRTLAEAMDALTRGDLSRAGDVLCQRFKSVEMLAAGESETLARQCELIPPSRVGLATEGERTMAARSELLRAKLAEISKQRPG